MKVTASVQCWGWIPQTWGKWEHVLAARYCMCGSCVLPWSAAVLCHLWGSSSYCFCWMWRSVIQLENSWYSSLGMCSCGRKPGCQRWMFVWSRPSVFGVTSFVFAVRMSFPWCAAILLINVLCASEHHHFWSMSSVEASITMCPSPVSSSCSGTSVRVPWMPDLSPLHTDFWNCINPVYLFPF